ncbi:hypothetical protein LWC35_10020 [Pseudonocardia kujensis]|uniref:hypothetical protein n=1 Tax=Pseudonocardia kujensis TaxID=1128675 RepID=UPI001E4B83CA|nr:hypothetical protein [Pseudonocardia kujensis]MCE0763240.1 hypothetical protein [Pseudonocardia kujensis]
MAGRARQAEKSAGEGMAEVAAAPDDGGTATETEQVRPDRPGEGRFEGHRSATVNLPFVTAQFRAPDLHAPRRGDLEAAARGARSMLPSGRSLLFFGGLAVTAAVGVIEWPVAAAIGVGSALASRGRADVTPRPGQEQPVRAETGDPAEAGGGRGGAS